METDETYARRRSQIADAAAGAHRDPLDITYLRIEDETWAFTHHALLDRWRRFAAPEILTASQHLGLPTDRVPQLREVTDRLARRTGFRFRAVPGLVPVDEFFGALALSTSTAMPCGDSAWIPASKLFSSMNCIQRITPMRHCA